MLNLSRNCSFSFSPYSSYDNNCYNYNNINYNNINYNNINYNNINYNNINYDKINKKHSNLYVVLVTLGKKQDNW